MLIALRPPLSVEVDVVIAELSAALRSICAALPPQTVEEVVEEPA